MKGMMHIKKVKEYAAYYASKGYNKAYGGKFTLFIKPLVSNAGDFFYYVEKLVNGKIEIMGKGYVDTNIKSLIRHKREAKKELGKKRPLYYWRDENGNIIKKSYN